jgi:hypothetical protein
MKNRWVSVSRRLAAIPAPATLFVLALVLFVWGALVLTPWFSAPAVTAAFAGNHIYEGVIGGIYMLIGGTRLLGVIFKNKGMMLVAPYGLMMGYLFLALVRIEVVGFFPLTWVPIAACAIISGICRLAILYGGQVE